MVGIPASLEQLVLSVLTIFVNYMLTIVSGSVAVAIYTAGWRIINIGMLPAIGVGTASISVAGVAFGAKKYENLRVYGPTLIKIKKGKLDKYYTGDDAIDKLIKMIDSYRDKEEK